MPSRFVAAILFAIIILSVSPLFAQKPLPPDDAWRKIKVAETEAYVMPDDVARDLGLHRRNIPDERNAATYYIQAINAWSKFTDAEESYESARARPWNEKEFPEIAQWLHDNEPSFALVDKAASCDECQFPIMMAQPGATQLFASLLPHLTSMREFSRALMIRAHLRERQGKPAEALRDYVTALKIGSHLGQDEYLDDGLVGVSGVEDALGRLRDSILMGKTSREQLRATLDTLLAADDLLPSPVPGLEGQKALSDKVVEMISQLDFSLMRGGRQPAEGPLRAFLAGRAWRTVFPDRAMRRDFAQCFDSQIARAKLAAVDPGVSLNVPPLTKPWNIATAFLLPPLPTITQRYQQERATLHGLIQVVALELCRADHGAYPESLRDLVPDYLPVLPPDPFSGRPFIYVPLVDSFVLYSVGPNRRDDLGRFRDTERRTEDYDIVLTILMP